MLVRIVQSNPGSGEKRVYTGEKDASVQIQGQQVVVKSQEHQQFHVGQKCSSVCKKKKKKKVVFYDDSVGWRIELRA